LAWTLVVWLAFAYAVGGLSDAGFFQEPFDEFADLPGMGWLGSVPSPFLVLGTVLLPLLGILPWQGRPATFNVHLTPTGPARELTRAGLAWFQRGGPLAAVAEFTEALRLKPRLVAAHVNRGVANYHLERFDEALTDLDNALRLDPRQLDALGWRGKV